ncbi:hypothetical protein GS927_25765, partial [Rhodococcus hoagii]|nr:hypothetical protein [Prescottella equi]
PGLRRHHEHVDGGTAQQRSGRPAADPRVRQAIAYSIDPEVLNQRVRAGEGMPAPTCSSRGPSGTATSTASPRRRQGQELLDQAKADGFNGRSPTSASTIPTHSSSHSRCRRR